jgi:hypothetical protein
MLSYYYNSPHVQTLYYTCSILICCHLWANLITTATYFAANLCLRTANYPNARPDLSFTLFIYLAQLVQRRSTGWKSGVRLPALHDFLSSSQRPERLWVPSSLLSMGTGALSPGIKRLGQEAGHSHPSDDEIKNGGAIPPLPHTSSRHDAKFIKHKDNFTITFHLCYLTTLSISRLHGVDDWMINECGAVGGMRNYRRNHVQNLPHT